MAEPMSSNEIEDVLSSIRRLVAQDLKPADRAKLAAVADATQKLVLAPENRVEDGPRSDAGQGAKFATVRRPSRRAAFQPVDAVLAGVDALTGHNGAPDAAPRDQASQDWALGEEAARAQALSQEQAIAMQIALDEQLSESMAPASTPPASTARANSADDRPSPSLKYHLDDANDAFLAIPPGYGDDDAPIIDDVVTIDPNARMFDLDARSFAQSPEDVAVKASQPDWEDGDEVAQDGALDEALDGALDGAAGDTGGLSMGQGLHGTIEPDPDWADAAEARVIAELAGEAVAEDIILQARDTFREPNFKSAPQSAPEVLFDEDQLRALVQAIFREEMAGPMGERITRNIRKLVRAEVGRMLAAQELE